MNIQKDRKKLIISAVVFSVLYIFAAVLSKDFYTAFVSIVLWGFMCFGHIWAKSSKILIDGILICVYAVSGWQIFLQYKNGGELPQFDIQLLIMVIVNVFLPLAEIIVIYKSQSITNYFIDAKKNKINPNIKR